MSISFMYTNGTLSIFINGDIFTVNKEHVNFKEIVKMMRDYHNKKHFSQKEIDHILFLLEQKEKFHSVLSNSTYKKISIKDGIVYFNNEEVNNIISSAILDLLDVGLPLDGIERFLENLSENPSYTSQQELMTFIQNHGLHITEDGCFLAYKVVQSDYLDKYSHTICNKPGSYVKMDRSKVNDNKSQHCSYGLHVGGLNYICWYGNVSQDDRIMIVKIDPKDAVSVPNDSTSLKLRVCAYTVLEEYNESLKDVMYSKLGEKIMDDEDCDENSDDYWDDDSVTSTIDNDDDDCDRRNLDDDCDDDDEDFDDGLLERECEYDMDDDCDDDEEPDKPEKSMFNARDRSGQGVPQSFHTYMKNFPSYYNRRDSKGRFCT